MTAKVAVAPRTAPAPYHAGHYSPGIVASGFVFTSGQGPITPETSEVLRGDIEAQTRLTIANLEGVLVEAGSCLQKIVKATIFLADLSDWAVFDSIWRELMPGVPPARTTVRADLLEGMLVEVDAIALA